jgi:hypothetical protein
MFLMDMSRFSFGTEIAAPRVLLASWTPKEGSGFGESRPLRPHESRNSGTIVHWFGWGVKDFSKYSGQAAVLLCGICLSTGRGSYNCSFMNIATQNSTERNDLQEDSKSAKRNGLIIFRRAFNGIPTMRSLAEDQSERQKQPMAGYGDRCTIFIKNFGRKIVIRVHRGKAQLSRDQKTIIINYPDDETRNKPKGYKRMTL